jgi:hypothetical protein
MAVSTGTQSSVLLESGNESGALATAKLRAFKYEHSPRIANEVWQVSGEITKSNEADRH